jgi:hypothetical protein
MSPPSVRCVVPQLAFSAFRRQLSYALRNHCPTMNRFARAGLLNGTVVLYIGYIELRERFA